MSLVSSRNSSNTRVAQRRGLGPGSQVRDGVGDARHSVAAHVLVVCGKEFEFYSKCERKSSEHFEEGSDLDMFFFCLFVCLFIYLWLCWVFVSVRGLSLVVASGGHSSSWCAGLSLSRPLLLWSTGSRRAGSVIVAHGPSRSVACGIFPDQGSNRCPLHWQADSQPLRHQGSPLDIFLKDCSSCLGACGETVGRPLQG